MDTLPIWAKRTFLVVTLVVASASSQAFSQPGPGPPHDELVFMRQTALGTWDLCNQAPGPGRNVTTLATTASSITPRTAPGGGRVAFVSDRDGNGDIYVIDFDGDDERRLTTDSYEERWPSWSPGGTQLTFSRDTDDDYEIWIMYVDESFDQRLTYNDAFDGQPAFSPDGRTIAFTSDRGGKHDIWTMNVDGTGAKCLTDALLGNCYYPCWSPDGQSIAFTCDAGGPTSDIWTMGADGTAPAALKPSPGTNEWAPAWSPDKKWIAFTTDRDGNEEIYVIATQAAAQPLLECNMSNSPLSNERYADFCWAREAVGQNATWERASDWRPKGVPTKWDRVRIPAGTTVTVSSDVKRVAAIEIEPANPAPALNLTEGLLQGVSGIDLRVSRSIQVDGRISAGAISDYGEGCCVSLDAWPGGTITVTGAVNGGDKPTSSMWTEHGGDVDLLASVVTIAAGGLVRGGDGGSLDGGALYGLSLRTAGDGGDVTIGGETIAVAGALVGGHGGDTNNLWQDLTDDCRRPQYGGDGGDVYLGNGNSVEFGGTRSLTVNGWVNGGKGGDVAGTHKGEGGNGGEVTLAVQWEIHGSLTIGGTAVLKGGNGGGRPVNLGLPVWGGHGGDVVIPTTLSSSVSPTAQTLGGYGGPGEIFPSTQCPCPDIEMCGVDGLDGVVTAQ